MRTPAMTATGAALLAACTIAAPVAFSGAGAISGRRATVRLARSAFTMPASDPSTGAVPGSQRRTIEVWMAGRQRAAQRFVDAVSTPGSPAYHRFLSPEAYTQRFGPRPAQVRAVRSYLVREGFTAVQASVDDDYISATAPVSSIDRAFAVQMRRYRIHGAHGAASVIESNDRDLAVPDTIGGDILDVTGLDSARPQGGDAASDVRTTAHACSRYWAQRTTRIGTAYRGLTRVAVPVCGYSVKQIRAAYDLTPADTGTGTTVAIIQLGSPYRMLQALGEYARANGLPAPRPDQYRLQRVGHGRCADQELGPEEGPIDSEALYAVAPGARQVMIDACAPDYVQGVLDAELAPLTGHRSRASAAIESISYNLNDDELHVARSVLRVSHAIALRAASEGVSQLLDSDDIPGVGAPTDDPDVTAVGGTTLGIGAHDRRLFETGWSTAFAQRARRSSTWHDQGIIGGAGGGASELYREPRYQQGVVPPAMAENGRGYAGRSVPDISADADPFTGMLLRYIQQDATTDKSFAYWIRSGGTSMATPLVAGIVADAEQGRARTLGFLNPLLYSLAGTSAYHDALPIEPSAAQTDRAFLASRVSRVGGKFVPGVQIGLNDSQDEKGTRQVTTVGYDTMTGLGTPNGAAFIRGLRSGR